MRSYSAWNFRLGCCLATSRSRPWRLRTFSSELRPREDLGRFASMLLRVPLRSTRPSPQGSFPPVAFFVATIVGTTCPSDFRCAMFAFALGLYEASCRDAGNADGSLVFRADPCTRAATPTPPRLLGVAFAVT